jgi:hypothetical protein
VLGYRHDGDDLGRASGEPMLRNFRKRPERTIYLIITSVALMFFVAWPAAAEPMTFRLGGNDRKRCKDCTFIQATGEIIPGTPKVLEEFIKALDAQGFPTGRIRLHSPGGSLEGGIKLGELLRARGIATEVGSDEPDPDDSAVLRTGYPSRRAPGHQASLRSDISRHSPDWRRLAGFRDEES